MWVRHFLRQVLPQERVKVYFTSKNSPSRYSNQQDFSWLGGRDGGRGEKEGEKARKDNLQISILLFFFCIWELSPTAKDMNNVV